MVSDFFASKSSKIIKALANLSSVIANLCLDNSKDVNNKRYGNHYVNFTVIDELKKIALILLKEEKPLMSDIERVVKLMFCMGVLFQCCMKINDFEGLNTKNIIEKIGDEINDMLVLIISRGGL